MNFKVSPNSSYFIILRFYDSMSSIKNNRWKQYMCLSTDNLLDLLLKIKEDEDTEGDFGSSDHEVAECKILREIASQII